MENYLAMNDMQITNPTDDENKRLMQLLSTSGHTSDDITNLASNNTNDQLKAFLIAEAKNEMQRVVRLSETLDTLETAFLTTINERVSDGSITLRSYAALLDITSTLLQRSNEIISSVLKDDSLSMVLTTSLDTKDATPTVTNASIVATLKTPQSRERVRNVINQILLRTQASQPDNSEDTQPNSSESEETLSE